MGIHYHLAADGISLTLLVLTGLAATAGVLFSWNITERTGEFFAFYLALIGGVYGVFLSADAMLLFVFYEIAIVPKYFLIANWGSTNREYGAMKLAIYSFAGSPLVLAALLWAHALGAPSFSLGDLATAAAHFTRPEQIGLFALSFFGFAVLAGLFPFHTWAPTGHVAAPTAASMLLAGVVMKLGAYGCLRVAMPLFPAGFLFFQTTIAWLALIGIVYAGLVALVQDDFKFVIGYSSVSHMGFVMLGLAAANLQAVSGAVLQMFSHGVIAGAAVCRGRADWFTTAPTRANSRSCARCRCINHCRSPRWSLSWRGLPRWACRSFSGFPAELTILIGTWKASRPLWAAVAALGILVAAAFTLRASHVAFFGQSNTVRGEPASLELRRPGGTAPTEGASTAHALPPITLPERLGAILLVSAAVLIGLKPDLLLNWIIPSLHSPLMQAVLNQRSPMIFITR